MCSISQLGPIEISIEFFGPNCTKYVFAVDGMANLVTKLRDLKIRTSFSFLIYCTNAYKKSHSISVSRNNIQFSLAFVQFTDKN